MRRVVYSDNHSFFLLPGPLDVLFEEKHAYFLVFSPIFHNFAVISQEYNNFLAR